MPDQPGGVHESIGFEVLRAIRRVVRSVSTHSRQLSRSKGMSVPQVIALKSIGEAGPVTVGQLARTIQLSAATTSRLADRLERMGLITRTRSAQDRRRVELSLTEAGRARYTSLPIPLQERVLERLAEMPESERLAVLEALERVVSLLDAEDLDAAPVLAPGEDLLAGE